MIKRMDHVLVVDDDVELCSLVQEYLTAEGFSLKAVHDGEEGLQQALTNAYALVVLDVMLPGMNGFRSAAPDSQRVEDSGAAPDGSRRRCRPHRGLEIGADDYLPKPFNPRELVARIRAILRRTKPVRAANDAPEVLTVGDVELDPATRNVLRAGQPVDLTSVEFNLLEVLLREAGRVVTRERLVNAVLSRKFMPFDRSIDMHVSKVRRKLGDSEEDGDHIKTIRGVGYMFARPATKPKK
jgi:two-component system response regulator CpxR